MVIAKGGNGYRAYSPGLPGCVAVGATREEAEEKMYEAITFRLEEVPGDGGDIPRQASVGE